MEIKEISSIYSALPQCGAFLNIISDKSMRHVYLKGLLASSASVFFAAVGMERKERRVKNEERRVKSEERRGGGTLTSVFILQDNDEAGYFYHDLTQILGTDNVLFFPSSYRRAVKYAQRDAANEILRTEALSRLAAVSGNAKKHADNSETTPFLYVVTHH